MRFPKLSMAASLLLEGVERGYGYHDLAISPIRSFLALSRVDLEVVPVFGRVESQIFCKKWQNPELVQQCGFF